jgi:hypothetical protein
MAMPPGLPLPRRAGAWASSASGARGVPANVIDLRLEVD